jgi:hypothetical protein
VENLSVSPIWKTHKKILTKYGATKIIFEFDSLELELDEWNIESSDELVTIKFVDK